MYIPEQRRSLLQSAHNLHNLSGPEADQHTGQQRRPAHLVQTATNLRCSIRSASTSLVSICRPIRDGFYTPDIFRDAPSHQQNALIQPVALITGHGNKVWLEASSQK